MKTQRFVAATLTTFIAMLSACGAPAAPAPVVVEPTVVTQTHLVLAGSGGAATVLKYVAEAYDSKNDDVTFEFLSGSSSGGGVKGALDGSLDLGILSRAPKNSEVTSGIAYVAFAADQIAFVTSPDITITGLTAQQVKDIFLGQTVTWSDVGGPTEAINVLVRDEDESSTQILRAALFGADPFAIGSAVFTSEGELRDALANVKNGIAFMSYGGYRLSDKSFNVLAIDGKTPADLQSGYPYYRPLGVAFKPSNAAKVQSFLTYIGSPEATALLAEKGIPAPK